MASAGVLKPSPTSLYQRWDLAPTFFRPTRRKGADRGTGEGGGRGGARWAEQQHEQRSSKNEHDSAAGPDGHPGEEGREAGERGVSALLSNSCLAGRQPGLVAPSTSGRSATHPWPWCSGRGAASGRLSRLAPCWAKGDLETGEGKVRERGRRGEGPSKSARLVGRAQVAAGRSTRAEHEHTAGVDREATGRSEWRERRQAGTGEDDKNVSGLSSYGTIGPTRVRLSHSQD
jgi:hypothetical protein